MVLQLTLARPYARAIFANAKETHQFEIWSRVLDAFSKIIKDKQIAHLIINPQISKEDIKELLLHVIKTILMEVNLLKEKTDCFLQLLID